MTTIREVNEDDALVVTNLSLQMDHQTTEDETKRNIKMILADSSQKLFVAENDGKVLGYVSVYGQCEILNGIQCRIGGLVVDESARGLGIGRQLMVEAENWAKKFGSKTLKLNSSVSRVEAHKFYEKIGYARTKEQAAFKKLL